MRVRATRSAAKELTDARAWYGARNPSTAANLYEDYLKARRLIQELPMAGSPHLAGTRRVFLERFPYALVYRVEASVATILAVSHGSQRPGYWLSRRG
ncbi:MAG: type II toxin-antitoxin system RelE/ParE family toxin [Chloroflexi bacterium]|nr:type II toxin-antitoxin system RelE/ParE family toxin [Chloroflexota bacterium]